MNENKDIEEIFKKAFENYEADPGTNTWAAIESNIGSSAAASSSSAAAGSAATSSWVATTVLAVALSTAIIGGYFLFDSKAEKKKTAAKENVLAETKRESIAPVAKSAVNESNNSIDTDQPSPQTIIKNELPNVKGEQEKTSTNDKASTAPKKAADDNLIVAQDSEPIAEEKKLDTSEDLLDNSGSTEQKGGQAQSSTNSGSKIAEQKNVPESENQKNEKSTEKSSASSNTAYGSTEKKSDTVIFDVPNIFTPNQDGRNDQWEIKVSDFDNIIVKVFNKTNELVYQHKATHLNSFWNGKLLSGNSAAEGVYIYQIVAVKGGKIFKKLGSVTLKR